MDGHYQFGPMLDNNTDLEVNIQPSINLLNRQISPESLSTVSTYEASRCVTCLDKKLATHHVITKTAG